jgi:hypothetical protein
MRQSGSGSVSGLSFRKLYWEARNELIAANAVTIFIVESLLKLCMIALIGCKTDREDARPVDTTGAKTDSLRAVCLE